MEEQPGLTSQWSEKRRADAFRIRQRCGPPLSLTFVFRPLRTMRIFYGSSAGRADVACETPVDASLDTALSVLRDLDVRHGFLGLALDDRYHLQLLRERSG